MSFGHARIRLSTRRQSERLTYERLVALSERERRQRARDMKTAKEALEVAWRGWKRLQELGFADACYCPKDGTPFEVCEWGSTGIFRCTYSGEWPDGHLGKTEKEGKP